jgi:hypothetical protein
MRSPPCSSLVYVSRLERFDAYILQLSRGSTFGVQRPDKLHITVQVRKHSSHIYYQRLRNGALVVDQVTQFRGEQLMALTPHSGRGSRIMAHSPRRSSITATLLYIPPCGLILAH